MQKYRPQTRFGFKTFGKIDVFLNGSYIHSTNAYPTCWQAVEGARLALITLKPGEKITARFDKSAP